MGQRTYLFLCLLTLLHISNATNYSKISTQLGNSLTASDYLISTLGFYRMTLNAPSCQLQIQNFTTNNYIIVGYHPKTAFSPCQSLSIGNNSLLSNNNDPILSLQTTQIKTIFDQVFVTIDEMGIIRINGVYDKKYESSQNWISLFRTPRQFVYSISNLSVSVFNSLPFIQNNGNWGFSATNGEIRMFKIDDVSKIIRYNYTGFTITPNNLFDYNSNSLPLANYNEFRYYSTCSPSGYLQNFQGPFIFVINPVWPELRFIDRNGYQIISLRYPNPNCMSMIGINHLHDTDSCMSCFCPENTFQLNGDCLASCPPAYFHQIGKNGVNRCVINCQATFSKDVQNRICACGQIPVNNCPAGLKLTPLGCLCTRNTFWNGYNQQSSTNSSLCLSSCGPFLFPHKDGICVPCPQYCQICTLSTNSFSYLICSVCETGFQLNNQGFCLKTSGNSSCSNCTVTNCIEFTSTSTCSVCDRPYSLFNNSCLVQCPRGFKSVFDQQKGFRCEIIPGCTAQSVVINNVNNQSSCFCTRNGSPSFSRNCGNTSRNNCKFDSYFDNNTQQCLMCPIGCLTCVIDRSSRIECTSCRPEYSLFVTITKNHYCERNSILSICPNTYDFNQQICSIASLNRNLSAVSSSRGLCFSSIPNCIICVSGSAFECSICGSNSYLINGRCETICPAESAPFKFQRVCIPVQTQRCVQEVTQNAYWLFIKNRVNQFADGYFYLISANFQANDYLNDPLGSIFTYLKTPDIQNRNKMVNIATSYQKCTKCENGYGLTSNNQCKQCLFPCLQCIFYSQKSAYCLKCDIEYRLTPNNTCAKLNITELPCKNGQYRNPALTCQPDCLTYYQQNRFVIQDGKQYHINCTVNCPNNYIVSSFINKDNQLRLACSQDGGSSNRLSIKFLGNKVKFGPSKVYMLISSTKLNYGTRFSQELSISTVKSNRWLAQKSNQIISYPIQFGIIIVTPTPSTSQSVIVNLPAAKMSSENKGSTLFVSSSVYGFDSNSKPFIDIILNQTGNLYFYGRAYTILAFLLTVIFLGERVNYKTDNLFTTFSVIYLSLPSLNLKPDSSSYNTYSFLYGFSWSAHLQFFSNPRSLTQGTTWFDGYLQKCSNNSHYLLFVDNNLIRNMWSILLILIIVVTSLALTILFMKCFSVKKQRPNQSNNSSFCWSFRFNWFKVGFDAKDFDHIQQVKYLIFFLVQNCLIGISYYCLLNILNSSWELAPSQKQSIFKIISFLFLSAAFIYSLLRTYTNRIGGLYCFKRIMLGLSYAIISFMGGLDQNIALGMIFLTGIEILFAIMRYRVEFLSNYLSNLCRSKKMMSQIPKNRIKTRHTIAEGQKYPQLSQYNRQQEQKSTPQASQFWSFVIQETLIILLYIFIVLVDSLKEVSVLIVWMIINVFMVNFALQFVDLIVDFWNKAYNKHAHIQKPFERRIRKNWDHDLSLKSLPTTTDL